MHRPGRGPERCVRAAAGGRAGSVLIPCLFLLSLLSLLAAGVIQAAGTGNRVCATLAQRLQARFAADSGLQIACRRLSTDLNYAGETCDTLQGGAASFDVGVTPLGDSRFELISTGRAGAATCLFRSVVEARSLAPDYPLFVGNTLTTKGHSHILGTCYVKGILEGLGQSKVTGDVHLYGERSVTYDSDLNAVAIDGYSTPEIRGSVYTDAENASAPKVDLSSLRDMALQSGRLISQNEHLTGEEINGVVYIDETVSRVDLENVTIHGVLASAGTASINVANNGFLKIVCDDDLLCNTALLAPQSLLDAAPNSLLDIFGLTLTRSTDFKGTATFTGPFLVENDLVTNTDSVMYCQFPAFMTESDFPDLIISEHEIVEIEFEEL